MKRYYQAYLLLLALTAWLLPVPQAYAREITVSEKVGITIEPQGSDWILEGDKVVAEQLYQEWLKEQAKPKPKPKQVSANKSTTKTKFAAGYCTDYVARKVNVTWRGNANRWIANAKAQGYLVDSNPTPGSILVTNESRYGHVTYIESVQGSQVTISEWNYAGRYQLTYRTLDISDSRIKGIIHP